MTVPSLDRSYFNGCHGGQPRKIVEGGGKPTARLGFDSPTLPSTPSSGATFLDRVRDITREERGT